VKGASQGSGGLFTPLFQLVRDPYGTIVGTADPQDAPNVEEEEDLEDRKQVLYLHMKDVGSANLGVIHMLTGHRPNRTRTGKRPHTNLIRSKATTHGRTKTNHSNTMRHWYRHVWSSSTKHV
jgi:hypothetical protein